MLRRVSVAVVTFYRIFAFSVQFAAKILQFWGLLRMSRYVKIILKKCEISEDLKKLLERWQRCLFEEFPDLPLFRAKKISGSIRRPSLLLRGKSRDRAKSSSDLESRRIFDFHRKNETSFYRKSCIYEGKNFVTRNSYSYFRAKPRI